MNITSVNIKNIIISKAKELGFEQIGFAKYEPLEDESKKLEAWLDKGYDADMAWIKKGFDRRKDIKNIMPDAKSVISLAYNYYTPIEHDESKPKISRYAWGKDYHKILKKKLSVLCNTLNQLPPSGGVGGLYYVDDGPVMDKAWAVRAGLGWQGKHSNVINPDFGSWFFICTIITNIEFDSYSTQIEDQCGSCTLCISACPTGAIIDEYVVDSNKCISYHTIENRGDIPDDINLDGWIFGCDVCQDVCPYNAPKYNRVTKELNFFPKEKLYNKTPLNPPFSQRGKERNGGGFAAKASLSSMTEEEFTAIFSDSPIKRTKFKGWKRNLALNS